jgi:rod shape-determining protein MreB
LDQAIAEYIRKKYGLAVGDQTAEEIKIEIGSAIKTDKDKTMEIRGRDMIAGLPKTITISANEVTESMQNELEKIVLAIKSVLEQAPPELSSDIIDRGMVMTGGGSLLRNLDRLFTKSLGIPCHVANDALLCVARGTGIALENLDDYKKSVLSR